VPFGTGPVVEKYLERRERLPASEAMMTTYHPEPFRMLADLFSKMSTLESEPEAMTGSQPEVLAEFLHSQQFPNALAEIRHNSASQEAFRKRFWRWFNMFRIMKFLHFAREHGFPDVDVTEAAGELLDTPGAGIETLLITLREIDHRR
jgi:hypothetical protein